MSIRTPNNLDILLHYHCSSAQHERFDAPAVQEGIAYLVQQGLLDRADFPAVTDKGRAYIEHILAVPFPEQAWVMPGSGDGGSRGMASPA